VSNEHLNLAKQNPKEYAELSKATSLSSPVYDDKELVRRAQHDDPWAFEQLVLRYQKKVYAIAYRMLSGDMEEAKDRTQEAFLQAFRKIKQFKGKASFYTWLYRIVVNTCIDAHRHRRRWKEIFFTRRFGRNKEEDSNVLLEEYPDTGKNSDPISTVSRHQLELDVHRALKTLSEKQRIIFQLKVFDELSISEIAESLNLAEGTVKTHLFRATQVVQKQLKEWADV